MVAMTLIGAADDPLSAGVDSVMRGFWRVSIGGRDGGSGREWVRARRDEVSMKGYCETGQPTTGPLGEGDGIGRGPAQPYTPSPPGL